ncbi:hypothetical protein EYW49_14245 [Siculibacillus lacustris]|uniref:Pyridoxamine 5'-phosphate oxidase family protein n=1 Tax=Siculibacillus lacustris TaxID=1549641 RepID=A0A4Q9VLC0_9HYPH|nr:hypothetical protein [Siculibacillus lacustris]TBW36263.1 hypothetical protein EYW49_14245 [Siculibacillus lacustris]
MTTDEDGTPRPAVSDFIAPGDGGTLLYFEPLESSKTQRNLTRAIWFDRPVSVVVVAADGRRFTARGRPQRAVIAGPRFQAHYAAFRADRGDVDLAAVWVIDVTGVEGLDLGADIATEERERPFFRHLDRIARA